MSPRKFSAFLLLLLLLVSLMVPLLPALNPLPNRDAGVYLYAGQRILHGDLLYRDVWDHKPPLIHWINACGLWIGNDHPGGVVLLEFISFAIAAALLYGTLTNCLDCRLSAFFGTVVFISSASPFLESGNLTEEYALPFQCLGVCCILKRNGLPTIWQCLVCGGATGFCALLRPNMIGIGFAAALLLLFYLKERGWRALLSRGAALGVGCSLVLLVAFLPFVLQNVAPDFLDQVFGYNAAYSKSSIALKLRAVAIGTKHYLIPNGSLLLALGAAFILTKQTLRLASLAKSGIRLGMFALVWLAIELPLSGLSGRPYLHYFMTWLAPLSLCGGFVAWSYLKGCESDDRTQTAMTSKGRLVVTIVAVAISLPQLATSTMSVVRRSKSHQGYYVQDVVAYVGRNSGDKDTVFLWGAESVINFLTNRSAGTRYAYQYPLLTTGYANGARIAEFVDSLSKSKPVILIDASSLNPAIPPIDEQRRANWTPQAEYAVPASLEPFYSFVKENYQRDITFDASGWVAYKLKVR